MSDIWPDIERVMETSPDDVFKEFKDPREQAFAMGVLAIHSGEATLSPIHYTITTRDREVENLAPSSWARPIVKEMFPIGDDRRGQQDHSTLVSDMVNGVWARHRLDT